MKKTDIERIIKGGSVRQKIKLYMTDIALCNVDISNIGKLLSDKERELLWSSIKEPQDVKYYKGLTDANASFLLFKDKLTIQNYKLKVTEGLLIAVATNAMANHINGELVNDLLEIYPDKKSRDLALKTIVGVTKVWGGKIYQEKGKPAFIEIDINKYYEDAKKYVELINTFSKQAKEIVLLFKKILSKDLPLQPYKDWLKEEEDTLKKTLLNVYNITTGIDGYSSGGHTPVIKYEDIEVVITDEDLEDFKGAGL